MKAHTAASGKIFWAPPLSAVTFIVASRTFGVTPTIPMPLSSAAIKPAVLRAMPDRVVEDIAAGDRVDGLARHAAHAGDARPEIDVRGEIRMVVLEAAVDVPDEDGRAAAGDRVRLDALDLAQTPLEARERVGIRRRLVGEPPRTRVVAAVVVTVAIVVVVALPPPGVELRRGDETLAPAQPLQERGIIRVGDDDADPVVAPEERPARATDLPRRVPRGRRRPERPTR